MSNRFTTNQSRAILICAGVLILLCTFFFVFQRNMDSVTEIEKEARKYKNQVNYLSNLQMQVNELQGTKAENQKEMDAYMKEFPCKMTQQKAIENIEKMRIKSGVRILAVKPARERKFLDAGTFITLSAEEAEAAAQQEAAATGSAVAVSDVEKHPEKQQSVDKMIGKVMTYEVEMSGTMKQIMSAFDWVAANKEHMSVTSLNLAFDSSTGKLTGPVSINYFAMNGNGKPYEEPNISGITFGSKNVFGTFK